MSSSIASTLITVFLSSLLLTFSTPHAASSSTLITKICASIVTVISFELCEQTLQSEPKVASAENFYDISVAIIQSGITRSENTHKHIQLLLKDENMDPNLKSALQQCNSSYDLSIKSLNSGLGEVYMKEYDTATYDLLLSGTDYISDCEKVVSSKVIKDKIIVQGNEYAKIFAFAATKAVDQLPYVPPS